MDIKSENPPEPDLVNLFVEFLRHVPSFDISSDDTLDTPHSLTPYLSPSFLSQLNPLLRARLTFNIQAFQFGNLDNSTKNFDTDRVLENVRHQWAELLSWPSPASESMPELGPILARKLYDSRDLLLDETQIQSTENESDNKVNIKGFARPDIETFLASAWLPATGIEIVWNWENAERAWRVNEVKMSLMDSSADGFGDLDFLQERQSKSWAIDMTEAITGVHGLKVKEQGEEIDDDDDDSYWGEYDKDVEPQGEDEKPVPSQESQAADVEDYDYYSRYDRVTTALSSESTQQQKTADVSPVHIHIQNSLRSLRDLARDSGMSQDEFMDLIREGVRG
ncbi:uncharacterized protein V1513DRAFT_452189 [Lipomyces chichibuensis]|uniref:uncharacterized protein n=1 Tax=Lipomyces chichibuensis TaxID=1546026 RepID=UPI0033432D94